MTEDQSSPIEGDNPQNTGPVDLNHASLEDLTELTGVGEVLARRIIEARPFQTIDDLSRVQGISSTLINQIRSLVMVSDIEVGAAVPAQPINPGGEELPVPPAQETPGEGPAKMGPDGGLDAATPPEELPSETYPDEMFPGAELEAPPAEATPAPNSEPIPAEEPAIAPTAAPAESPIPPAPAQAARRTIAPSDVLWITAGSGILAIFISVALTLGILAALNGGLNFLRPADLVLLERRIDGLSANTGIIENEVNSLRGRLSNLEGLSGRISSVEQSAKNLQENISAVQENLDALGSQIGALSDGIEEVQTEIEIIQQDTGRFNTFLSGLAELLGNVSGTGADTGTDPGGK